ECGVDVGRIEEAELQSAAARSDRDRELADGDVSAFIGPIGTVVDRYVPVDALDRSLSVRGHEPKALATSDRVRERIHRREIFGTRAHHVERGGRGLEMRTFSRDSPHR